MQEKAKVSGRNCRGLIQETQTEQENSQSTSKEMAGGQRGKSLAKKEAAMITELIKNIQTKYKNIVLFTQIFTR